MTIAEWRKRLLEAGFFPYTIGRDKEFYRLADEFFQAKVWKDKKLAYFVNAYLYEHSRYRSADHPHIEDGIMFEVHFFREKQRFDVTYHDAESVNEALSFFEEVYERMNCVPDIHNNE